MQKLTWAASLGILGLSTSLLAADDNGVSRIGLEALDTNGDGVISFAEFQESDRSRLSRIDTDQNGVLTIDEFLNARPVGNRRRQEQQEEQSNTNGDASERRAAMREMMAQRATERFNELDVNGDETVTLAEFQEASFDMMDRDGDGVLSESELRRPRRGGPGIGGLEGRRGGFRGQRGSGGGRPERSDGGQFQQI